MLLLITLHIHTSLAQAFSLRLSPWLIYCFSIVQVEGQLAKRLPLPTNEICDTNSKEKN